MRKAFTLIELMVVVAIIMILAAIIFPVFSSAKTSAWKAKSISNLHQIGIGDTLYREDYDFYFMPTHETIPNPKIYWWGRKIDEDNFEEKNGLIYPYISSSLKDPLFNPNLATKLKLTGYGHSYYSLINYLGLGNSYASVLPESIINTPAEVPLFATSGFRFRDRVIGNMYLYILEVHGESFYAPYHDRGIILYIDGHTTSSVPKYNPVITWYRRNHLGGFPIFSL